MKYEKPFNFTNVILVIALKYSYPFESIFYHDIRIADAILAANGATSSQIISNAFVANDVFTRS